MGSEQSRVARGKGQRPLFRSRRSPTPLHPDASTQLISGSKTTGADCHGGARSQDRERGDGHPSTSPLPCSSLSSVSVPAFVWIPKKLLTLRLDTKYF
jgi:hypothetical protein